MSDQQTREVAISTAIRLNAERDPDRPAITCGEETITRAALERRTNRLAHAYEQLGVGQDDLVTIALPNSIEFLEAAIAVWKLGATPQPVSSPVAANVQCSGRDGGHDLHYRTLQAMGVNLLGHFTGVEDEVAHFASDLAESVAFGEARYADLTALIRKTCTACGMEPPDMPPPPRSR